MANRSVSFIIPAFNCQDTVEESIASILDGNLDADDEVVVVDDGSTDNTPAKLAKAAARNKSVRVITHDKNRGGGAARNTAVAHARHSLIFCLDSDNALVPGSVPALVARIGDDVDAVTFREVHYFRHRDKRPGDTWRYRPGPSSFADLLAGHVHPAASGNYLFTRSSWERAGRYPEFAGALDTWGFGLRQLASGQRMVIAEDGHYLHRAGQESYWVREARNMDRICQLASELLSPYVKHLSAADQEYVSGIGRTIWFAKLGDRPLRLASGEVGCTGRAIPRRRRTLLERLMWWRP